MAHVMNKYFDELVDSTVRIIQFDSSMKAAEENFPFGKENAECLQFFLSLAESFGFETHNYDNYVGEVVFGKGEEFAVLAHLDVVPAGSGWKYPPFGGVINDEPSEGGVQGKKIWGRGTMDDKGPAMACLYALKAMKDEGFMPRRTIKLIVGCNEESGWQCIKHYNEVAKMPEEGFTPDANFPVIYAEKGILHFTLSFPINNAPMSALKAGEAANMVCDYASAIIEKKAAAKLVNYQNPVVGTTLSYDNTTNILQVYGKSAHGSLPHLGANAFQALLAFLAQSNDDCKAAYELLFEDGLGLSAFYDETGVPTISPDVASFKDGVLNVTCDVRFPATFSLTSVKELLDQSGVAYVINNEQPPLYNDKDGKLISTLCRVYENATGTKQQPIAIGGGTYARALKFGCAFGPEGLNEEACIHQPNEYITLEKLAFLSEVYYDALKEICKPTYTRIGWIKVSYPQAESVEETEVQETVQAVEEVEPQTEENEIVEQLEIQEEDNQAQQLQIPLQG